jgi:hypothetical protein
MNNHGNSCVGRSRPSSVCFACSDELRIPSRYAKEGPEKEFLDCFLENVKLKVPSGCAVTLFQEPRLESGFPDIVIVVWHMATAEQWNPQRKNLTNRDCRIMHYLSSHGSSEIETLQNLFGRCLNSLECLEESGMLRRSGRKYVARPLSKSYAVRHIIAIEAKIKEWRGALDQAFLNTWFASTSFVMMPHLPKEEILREKASSMGISVWNPSETVLDVRKLKSLPEPQCYASWMFNEWAWRATHRSKEIS